MKLSKAKTAFLAAASMTAAAAALAPATASDLDPAAFPQTIAVEAPQSPAPAVDHADENKPVAARKWGLMAIAAGALSGLVKLIGARKIASAVTETTVKGARIAASAASGAAKATGRALASPLRFLALMFGLSLFALTGAGIYDIEWIFGLLSGAALTGAGLYGLWKTRRALAPIKAKRRPPGESVNGN